MTNEDQEQAAAPAEDKKAATENVEETEAVEAREPADGAEAGEDPATTESAEAAEVADAGEAPATGEAAEPSEDPATTESAEAGEVVASAGEAADKPRKKDKKQRGRPRRKLEDLKKGEKMAGKVVGTAKFGAFVDIGAMTDGLVHVTEIPGKRIEQVEDVLSSGDSVEVWVKDIDLGKKRISLTMKPPVSQPLSALEAGAVVTGTVSTITAYGVFVDIGSETEGLVHISEMSSGFVAKPEEIVKGGDTVEVRVKEIDQGRKRISLSMIGLANDVGQGAEGEQPADDGTYEAPEEVEEHHPTVVELALRRALGQDDEDDDFEGAGEVKSAAVAGNNLHDIYAKMLADYREDSEVSETSE